MPRTSATPRSGPTPVRVRADEVFLELADVLRGDARLAEGPEPRVDAVDARRVVTHGGDGVDRRARRDHARTRLGVERDLPSAARDVLERLESQRSADKERG